MAICDKYVYQKLLKLDDRTSSYGKKKFGVIFMFHSVYYMFMLYVYVCL